MISASSRKSSVSLKSQANIVSVILATAFILAQTIIVADNETYTGHILEETGSIAISDSTLNSASADNAASAADTSAASGGAQSSDPPSNQQTAPSEDNPSPNDAATSSPTPNTADSAMSDNSSQPQNQETEALSNNSASENAANDTGVANITQGIISVPEQIIAPQPKTPPESSPSFEISLSLPSDIARGESFSLTAAIANKGAADAKNVILDLLLPGGATVLEENPAKIGLLKAGESVDVKFTVKTSYNTALGANEIQARVSYE